MTTKDEIGEINIDEREAAAINQAVDAKIRGLTLDQVYGLAEQVREAVRRTRRDDEMLRKLAQLLAEVLL